MSYSHTEHLAEFLQHYKHNMDLYEFGVCEGKTFRTILNIFYQAHIPFRKAYGFDSWVGLPKAEEGEEFDPEWVEGCYSTCKYLGIEDKDEAQRIIQEKLPEVILIGGFFNVTLNEETVRQTDMGPASLINIDVDLYSSTRDVLDFCIQNGILVNGTVVRYDDWNYEKGNKRAHDEAVAKYNLNFEELSDNIFVLR